MSLSGRAQTTPSSAPVALNDPRIRLFGQIDLRDPQHPQLAYPGTGFLLRFTGSSVTLHLASTADTSALTVVVNHGAPLLYTLTKGDQAVTLAAGTEDGPQEIAVYKRTETWQGVLTLNNLELGKNTTLLPAPELPKRRLLFIGDSVTCGTGLNDTATCVNDRQHPSSNAYETYGLLLGRRFDAESRLVCYGGRGLERDYLGHESKDGTLTVPELLPLSVPADKPEDRAPSDPHAWQPDAVVVSVGTNDFNLQKTKPLDSERWIGEYVTFAHQLRAAYPKALIFLTEGSIVTNPLLRDYVQQTVTRVGDPNLRYLAARHYPGHSCDGHPTEAQHRGIADDFEPVLQQALGW